MKKTLLGMAVALSVVACSAPRDANQPLEVWSNQVKTTGISTEKLGQNQSLAVFYRQDNVQDGAVNIYIDGHYQASLLANSLSPVAVCADKHHFSASFSSNAQFGNRTDGVKYTLAAGEITYVKVVEERNGKLHFVRVDKDTAQQEIAQLPTENQTLSRVPVAKDCEAPVVIAAMEVDSSAIFAFNTYQYKDILPAGREKLEAFMEHIKTMNATKMVISGHTDDQGTHKYNLALSQKRADTVKDALQKIGVTVPMQAIGLGEAEPVVTNCGNLKGAAKAQCNLPNRRVEITVYGSK